MATVAFDAVAGLKPPEGAPVASGAALDLPARKQALLDLIDAEARRQCAAVAEAAAQQVTAIRERSRDEARARLREAFAQERERAQARVAAARAELHTQQRLQAQQRASDCLARAWQQLPAALAARWQDAAHRRRWVMAALHEAARVLPAGGWQLVHAPGWTAAERQAVLSALGPPAAASTGEEAVSVVECIEDPALVAGLRVLAGGNVVDATVAGLTADRRAIGARLLALMEAAS